MTSEVNLDCAINVECYQWNGYCGIYIGKNHITLNTRLALFYSLIIHCISFVYSSLPRPLSKITVARDRYLTKDFNNGLGSEL